MFKVCISTLKIHDQNIILFDTLFFCSQYLYFFILFVFSYFCIQYFCLFICFCSYVFFQYFCFLLYLLLGPLLQKNIIPGNFEEFQISLTKTYQKHVFGIHMFLKSWIPENMPGRFSHVFLEIHILLNQKAGNNLSQILKVFQAARPTPNNYDERILELC